MNKLFVFFACFAVAFAASEFVFPKNGSKMIIGELNNVTWPDVYTNPLATGQLTFEFNSETLQDILKETNMTTTDRQTDVCPIPIGADSNIPIDLRIPVGKIQDFIDSLNLPIEIDVESIVNNVLANVDQLSESDRNVTIALYKCNAEEPDYVSWVVIDSAKSIFVGALAVLLSVFLLL
ncbi:hypothetical protein J8273_3486 [Carpediemonas membranifera]|uniref:Uncharacterized protein n=1 Tax=Carpediemonas membranifera TaxID=201153 RepID=A0A8J6BXD1_9EUKA|nr:hypothetical protein J8273_3484 [Carpediemonas membranifera]KAG9393351.1 hypothetical protein J8273_3486 [Carpediemonas membranifera]|eukprot:KAG9393349.1 hypothetical protein J8273_3484 [Carpediemonas membranifera]